MVGTTLVEGAAGTVCLSLDAWGWLIAPMVSIQGRGASLHDAREADVDMF